jgi:hypothetical protein
VHGHIPQFNGTTGKLLIDGLVPPAGAIVGTTDAQTLSNKTMRVKGVDVLTPGALIADFRFINHTAVGNMTVWSANLPANLMTKDGDSLRLTAYWVFSGTSGPTKSLILYLDGAIMTRLDFVGAAQIHLYNQFIIGRQSATSVTWIHGRTQDTGVAGAGTGIDVPWDHSIAHTLRLDLYNSTTGQLNKHCGSTLDFVPLL